VRLDKYVASHDLKTDLPTTDASAQCGAAEQSGCLSVTARHYTRVSRTVQAEW